MGNNFFFSGTDPLLGRTPNYDEQLMELNRMEEAMQQRKQALKQAKEQVMSQQNVQPAKSRTPVWDEVDSLLSSLSDKEYEKVANSDEFIESQNILTQILNQKYMEIMRPIVEESKEGKQALEYHLTLVKRLKSAASAEADNELKEFAEYKAKYSHMSYDEYLKTKRTPVKKGGKK